ncbi:MAG TPA: alpha/beta hydrolase [Mycobacteriales bacterium]|nr:alpha/beta hydrolase [Mycobacteriales bacterium]
MTTDLIRSDVRVDVGDDLQVAATVVAPSGADDGAPRVVAFGFPGGGLGRGYFDVVWEGDDTYSEAVFHAGRGWVFIACDHLGVGGSSQPDPTLLTYARLAAGDDAAVRALRERLAAGTLVDGLGPVAVRGTVGLGHSMGGCISIVTQANHATFDALGVLGFSAIQTSIPTPQGVLEVEHRERDDASSGLEQDIEAAGGVGMFRWAFYAEDVPRELVDADMGSGYPRSGTPPPWGSATTPPVVFTMMTPGVVSAEAAAISAPVLVASGSRDVIPDLRAEAAAYSGTRDITLVEVPGMAHMHAMAGTRTALFARIHAWAESVLP